MFFRLFYETCFFHFDTVILNSNNVFIAPTKTQGRFIKLDDR